MIGVLIQIGIAVALWAINKYLFPRPQAQAARKFDIGAFSFPRNDEAVPIPIFWGTVRIRGPIVIFAKLFDTDEIKRDDQIIGYKYRIAVQLLLGTPGGQDGSGAKSELRRFYVGERLAWSGVITDPAAVVYVNKPELLGGEGAGGGVEGVITYKSGTFTQTNGLIEKEMLGLAGVNQDVAYRGQAVVSLFGIKGDGSNTTNEENGDAGYYLRHGARIDDGGHPGINTELWLAGAGIGNLFQLSNYRDPHATDIGNAPLGLANALATRGFYVGESPTIDAFSFEVFARTFTTTWTGGSVGPIGHDANPMNVLYDIITNPWNRAGRPVAGIDTSNFRTAALTLANEKNGFSLLTSNAIDAREVAQLVLEQIDGVLYEDFGTGKLKIALIREDYTVGSLDTLDTSNVEEVIHFSSGTWNETYNLVRVIFTDRDRNYQDGTAVAHDQANYYSQSVPRMRPREIRYPGCTSASLASKLAARDLRALSLPLRKIRIAVQRNAYTKRPGDVFKFTWPEYGLTNVVFRVIKYDLGKLGTERVILDCVEDRWAFDNTVFDLPTAEVIPFVPPWLSTERVVEEAPRWIANKAYTAGRVFGGPEEPRIWNFAVPRGFSSGLRAQVTEDLLNYADDTNWAPFPVRFTVETAYSRALDPYDTTTGLRITGLVGINSPPSATATQIRQLGKNTFKLGDEWMAYESATLISGSVGSAAAVWKLNNVWRGIGDTAPVAHAVGERGYMIGARTSGADIDNVGRNVFEYGKAPVTRLLVQGLGGVVTPTEEDDDVVNTAGNSTIVMRALVAYPPADLKIGSSKTPSQLQQGAVSLTWKRRRKLYENLRRGDEVDEGPESTCDYDFVAKKSGSAIVTISSDIGNGLTAYTGLIGKAGYGTISVGIRSSTRFEDGGVDGNGLPTTTKAVSPYPTMIDVDAPEWRLLLRNGDGSEGTAGQAPAGWVVASGSPIMDNAGGNGLGGAGGYFIAGSTASWDMSQTVELQGYELNRLDANLTYFAKIFAGDANDTLTVDLIILDSSDSQIGITTDGPFLPNSVWTRREVGFSPMPAGAAKIKVRVRGTEVAVGGTTSPDVAVTELRLRVGQGSGTQCLLNNSFESGTFTNWTNVTNSFKASTASPLYDRNQYAQAGDFASSEIRQDFTIPTGFEIGATAVLEFARMNKNSDNDTMNVILEIRDGSSALASVSTGAEIITPSSTWARRRLAVAIPQGATTVRVRLVAARATGTTCDCCIDDMDLRVVKKLDPTSTTTLTFDTPASQPLPLDLDHWNRAWPTIAAPDVAMWCGDNLEGKLGNEPTLYVDDTGTVPPAMNGKFIGAYDATAGNRVRTSCWDFVPGADVGIQCQDSEAFNYTSSQSFTVFVAFKVDPALHGTAMDLVNRYDGSLNTGWRLYINTSGKLVAEVRGSASKTATGARTVTDGAVRFGMLIYDAGTANIRIVDEDGAVSTSTAGLGQIQTNSNISLTIGDGAQGNFVGQIARVFAWKSARSTADGSAMMLHGGLPPGATTLVNGRTSGAFAVRVGDDVNDEMWSFFGPDQIAVAYDKGLKLDGGTGYGLAMWVPDSSYGNKVAQIDHTPSLSANWVTVGATVTDKTSAGVDGRIVAFTVAGTNAQGRELRNITVGAGTVRVGFFARATANHSIRIELFNSSGTSKGSVDQAIVTGFKYYEVTLAGWDASTATCRVRFCGSNTGSTQTAEFCGPFLVNQAAGSNPGIPLTGTADSAQTFTLSAPQQLNTEGEIAVVGISPAATPPDGTLIEATNGTNNNDRRNLYVVSGGAKVDQYDGAASNTTSVTGAVSWNVKWTHRNRWCRAALLDAATAFGGVLFGDLASVSTKNYGRAAAWTPGTLVLDVWKIGGTVVGSNLPAVIRSITIRTRELRLPQ